MRAGRGKAIFLYDFGGFRRELTPTQAREKSNNVSADAPLSSQRPADRHRSRQRRKSQRQDRDRFRNSRLAPVPLVLLLINLSQWLALAGASLVTRAATSFGLSLLGVIIAWIAGRAFRKHSVYLQGEHLLTVGRIGNQIVLVVSALALTGLLYILMQQG